MGFHHQIAKILGLDNLNLWQKLNSFEDASWLSSFLFLKYTSILPSRGGLRLTIHAFSRFPHFFSKTLKVINIANG